MNKTNQMNQIDQGNQTDVVWLRQADHWISGRPASLFRILIKPGETSVLTH